MSNYFKSFGQECQEVVFQRDCELSRILTAAVINEIFRKLLLKDPESAIRSGYAGENFHLAIEETQKLSLIRAGSLAEFATQMNNLLP